MYFTDMESTMIDEPDEATKNRLVLAWKLIIEQFYDKSKSVSSTEGPGISIFRFLRTGTNKSNCTYFYAEKDGPVWKMIMSESPDGRIMQNSYDSSKHILICVQIPLGIHGDDTTGTMKLFDIDSGKEISEAPEKDHVTKISEDTSSGIHRRKP